MTTLTTLAANLKHASWTGANTVIGGGVFTPRELQNGAKALEVFPELLDLITLAEPVLEQCGYLQVAKDARAAIAKATGATP